MWEGKRVDAANRQSKAAVGARSGEQGVQQIGTYSAIGKKGDNTLTGGGGNQDEGKGKAPTEKNNVKHERSIPMWTEGFRPKIFMKGGVKCKEQGLLKGKKDETPGWGETNQKRGVSCTVKARNKTWGEIIKGRKL